MIRRLLLATCLLASAASWIAAPPRPALADEPKVVAPADPAPAPPAPVPPKAIVRAPKSVAVGGTVLLDATGSVSDADQPLQWQAIDPDDLDLVALDKGGRPGVVAAFTAAERREYVVGVTACGHDAKGRVVVDTRVVRVMPGGPAPTPEPTPPGPGPTPGPTPTPGPETPMAKVARDFVNGVLEAYAASWETNATVLASGQPASAASAASDAKLRDLRMAAFRATFYPELNRVLPEGTDVKDQAQRDAITRMERDFAAALRGLKR
jgi:hypothetical protein